MALVPATIDPIPTGEYSEAFANVETQLTAVDVRVAAAEATILAGLTPATTVDVTITTAQLKALNTTPITLVAAPAAGSAIIVVDVQIAMPYATTAYDGIAAGEDLEVRYTNGTGQLVTTVEATGFLDQAANAYRFAYPVAGAAITPVSAAAIVLFMATGNIATGDSPLHVRVRYRTVTLAI